MLNRLFRKKPIGAATGSEGEIHGAQSLGKHLSLRDLTFFGIDAGGALQVKMDERQFRFLVLPGARDAYLASGWEVFGPGEFEAGLAALKASGTAYELGDTGLCAQRRVQQIAVFKDPSGNRHELVWGFQSDFVQFASPTGIRRFVTGNIGMGHTVLPAPNFEATAKFMREVMGFGLSDLFNFKPAGEGGPVVPIHFFHCNNGQHHSLAVAGFLSLGVCLA